MKMRILVLLLTVAAFSDAGAQTDSSTVLAEQQELITHIVQRVASGVLEIPDGSQPSAEQLAMIESVTRSLVSDLALYRQTERKQLARMKAREERLTSIIINVAKGTAIVIALLVLRAIIKAVGLGVQMEDPEAAMSVLVAAKSEDEANTIGRALIDDHLAAKGSMISPVRSITRGNEGIDFSEGVLLALKTTQNNVPAIIGHVVENTPAPVPDIVALPRTSSNDPDLAWVRKLDKKAWWKELLRLPKVKV